MNKLNQLKKKIQKAVPEIMELKEGVFCEVNDIYNTKTFGKFLLWDETDKNGQRVIIDTGNDRLNIRISTKKRVKILGRPITLEDVLKVGKDSGLMVDTYGYFWGIIEGRPPYKIEPLNIKWQLNKPLDQQPKETIDFLYELICK